MRFATAGIHHVTAIAGDPQRNLDFYAGVLGLRLVKRTINFDDPTSYHFYFGDEAGRPGSLLTFFPWGIARPGRTGAGFVGVTSLAIAPGSLGFWIERLLRYHVPYDQPSTRFDGERVVAFKDPDGLLLELVAHASAEPAAEWKDGPVPSEHCIRGIRSVTLWEGRVDDTGRILTERLGFRLAREQGSIYRYAAHGSTSPSTVDVRAVAGLWTGTMGPGVVHHVAFRAPDEADQLAVREELVEAGYDVTPQLDRQYFKSAYFREPGGVLFELATDGPGMTVDEDLESLGRALQLPPWAEVRRFEIEALLPTVRFPLRIAGPAG